MAQRVGIIGKGSVGTALQSGFERAGYETRIGGKGSASETARWGEIIVLAVPYSEVERAIEEAGSALDEKIVVDVTNALNPDFQLAIGFTTSGAEEIQKRASSAKIVKCFNTVFASSMSDGCVRGQQVSAFVAADDESARAAVVKLAGDIGFDAVDCGSLQSARWLEALGYLNIQLGFIQKLGSYIGFKLIH